MMLPEERHRKILELLSHHNVVSVTELSQNFNVTPVTVRRDLEKLEQLGLLIRTHGGAVPKVEPFLAKSLTDKEMLNRDAKVKIGEKATSLVNDGETVILDGGSTCIEIARALHGKKNITVVTNGIKVALELIPNRDIRTILVGGVGSPNFEVSGLDTVESFRKIRAHKYLMGADAIIPGYGISDGDPDQVQLKLAKAQASQEVICVADRSKLGRIAVAYVGPLSMADYLVMDAPISESFKTNLRKENVELIEVD